MPRVVYVSSLSHSGSTLVGMMLSAGSRVVCLGEVYPSIMHPPSPKRECTCGKMQDLCDIWGRILKHLEEGDKQSYVESYKKLLRIVGDQYGEDSVIVDLSKNIHGLRALAESEISDIRVLFTCKDIRNYCYSQITRSKRKSLYEKDGWRGMYSGNLLYNTLKWRFSNGKIDSYIRRSGLNCLRFSYEELCFHTSETKKKISEFTDIDFNEATLKDDAMCHIIRGNRMRFDSSGKLDIKYDARWTNSRLISFFSWLFLPFMSSNRRLVYSNCSFDAPFGVEKK